MAKTAMTQEEQLEDLQRRFTLLEGERKATFETAKLNISQNKDIIKQMKVENKLLREQIAQLRNEKPQSIDKQLDMKMSEVQKLQRQYDALHAENLKKRNDLDNLDGKLNELKIDANMPKTEASPQMRQIRVLENRLDKAMIKYNEAQSIRKTYEQIVKRLKEERIGFDNQLAGIERTLKAKERDYEELLLLSHDAYHAKEMAQAELHRFEQGVMEERNQRDKEVQEKKVLVQQRVEMNQRLEQRERMLKKQQDQDRAGERQLKEMSVTSDLTAGISNDYAQEAQSKVNDYEEAFRRIKDATGVSDVNEVIQKFLTQEQTHKKLTDLTRENQQKIDQLQEERRKLRLQVEDLKFSSGGNVGRRQAIDDFEGYLNDANEKFERNRAKYERLAKMLINMKAGISHLCEKLTIINLEDAQQYEMSDETVVDVLQQCELKLSKLLTRTRDFADPDNHGRSMKLDDDKYEAKLLAKSASDVRIKLNDQEQDGDDDDDDFEEDVDEDVCNRKHVKYMSEQLMEKEQTRKRKKVKGKKKDP
jgi:chromosome segregation ATPase|mmetsp:Transcript_38477/g.60853  ORF Transcript_38477/g.60853 Transcript_38477/m.60853 type:complete len:534 (+) Transcript_38477:94-1695(+)